LQEHWGILQTVFKRIKEMLNILEIFSGWDGRLAVWGFGEGGNVKFRNWIST
jgi:hypothetical protein